MTTMNRLKNFWSAAASLDVPGLWCCVLKIRSPSGCQGPPARWARQYK
jgi:hypothetical protein